MKRARRPVYAAEIFCQMWFIVPGFASFAVIVETAAVILGLLAMAVGLLLLGFGLLLTLPYALATYGCLYITLRRGQTLGY